MPQEPASRGALTHSLFGEPQTPWPHQVSAGLLLGPWVLTRSQQLPSRVVSSPFMAAPGPLNAHTRMPLSPAFPGSVEVVDVINEERGNGCKNATGQIF